MDPMCTGTGGSFASCETSPKGSSPTPKDHQPQRVDLSVQLRSTLRLWRRHQRAAWLKKGEPRPEWIFASSAGTISAGDQHAFSMPFSARELNAATDRLNRRRKSRRLVRTERATGAISRSCPLGRNRVPFQT